MNIAYANTLPYVVYHYTSMATLLKILTRPAIHATGVNYLNDTTEREHFIRLVSQRLPSFIKENSLTDTGIFDTFSERASNLHSERALVLSPFVASFSEDGDLLNQWRSYCAEGNGVSIGFRAECLRGASFPPPGDSEAAWLWSAPTISFRKIAYLNEERTDFVDDGIKRAMARALLVEKESDPENKIAKDDSFAYEIDNQACFVKHDAFSTEREYRLLVGPVFTDYSYLNFRTSKSTLIPYIEVPIPLKAETPFATSQSRKLAGLSGSDYIAEIIVGPTPNKELSIEALQTLLRKCGLVVDVRASSVPFRDL